MTIKQAMKKARMAFAAKQEAKEAKDLFEGMQADTVKAMHDADTDHFEIDMPEGTVKVSLVEVDRMILDEDALRARLGEDVWAGCTKEVLDKDLLEARIATGEIDADIVQQCAEWRPNKPFVKFTVAVR